MGKEIAHQLTPNEKQLLQLLSHGLTEKEVAHRMNKSVFTIDKYLRSVFDKFDVHNTTAVVAEAIRRGEIE
ncbi:MAG: LuxR C-terminal-related transcriptional regulator [Bacteroidota bacterium]